jgi:glucosamine-6-phosphate deaminase
MDEYIGLPPDHPQRFVNWLRRNFFDRIPLKEAFVMQPSEDDPEAEARAYADLLAVAPIDIVTLGIGVNGHIAFNDPPVADFNDPLRAKVVELDVRCRQQQVEDGCFEDLADVPMRAVTVSVTGLMDGRRLFAVVPGRSKREAVRQALYGPVTTACPASILRTHANCTLYLDGEADPDA